MHTDLDAVVQTERSEQNSIKQRQALLHARRTASWKQGRSQRIGQRRVMTEKARKVRARLVRRRNAPGIPDGREGEDRPAGSSERVVKLRTRTLSPYVLIDIEEMMEAVGYRNDGRTRGGSPFVHVEAD